MEIRKAIASDAPMIVRSQLEMAMETENLKLNDLLVEKGVAKFFEYPTMGTYWIAEQEGKLMACLLVQNEWSDWRNLYVWWIHSVYVKPAFRKQGIYGKMYTRLKQEVMDNPELAGLRLFVDKTNKNAQMVYSKLGMTDEHYELFEWMKDY